LDRLDNPILKHATTEVLIDVMTNDHGDVYVLHDRPFPEAIGWIEYDQETTRLDFISEEGRIRFFGVKVPKHIEPQIIKGEAALMVEITPDGEMKNKAIKSLIVRKDLGV